MLFLPGCGQVSMAIGELLKSATTRLFLMLWVVTVAAIAIFPLLLVTAVFIAADITLMVVSTITPGVGPINFRFIFGKANSPGRYLYRWYKWIEGNMNVVISDVPSRGVWIPPLLP